MRCNAVGRARPCAWCGIPFMPPGRNQQVCVGCRVRRCVICSASFGPRPREKSSSFKKRQTCSDACLRKCRATKLPHLDPNVTKPCACCGKPFGPRPRPGTKGWAYGDWRSAENCSRSCASKSRVQSVFKLPSKEVPPRMIAPIRFPQFEDDPRADADAYATRLPGAVTWVPGGSSLG